MPSKHAAISGWRLLILSSRSEPRGLANDLPRCSISTAGALFNLSRLRRALVDWDASVAAHVVFYSSYELSARPGDQLIRHGFERIRKLMGDSQRTDEVYVLGQPLVQDTYLDDETYLSYLGQIKRQHA